MLQALLADRFKLTFHRQTKDLPVYALTVGKNGHKLHESEGDGPGSIKPNKLGVVAQRTTLAEAADLLSQPLQTPVVDMTGLTGRYDFSIDLAPYISGDLRRGPGDQAPDIIAIAMTAIQEQLGLKLEPRKAPIEMLVVDHAEKVPTEN